MTKPIAIVKCSLGSLMKLLAVSRMNPRDKIFTLLGIMMQPDELVDILKTIFRLDSSYY